MGKSRGINAATTVIGWLGWLALAALCAGGEGCKSNSRSGAGSGTAATGAELRRLAMSAADQYFNDVSQGLDKLSTTTKNSEISLWAQSQVVGTGYAAITNVTGPNDAGAMLDMLVYATLKRYSMEEHWVPHFLHAEGEPLIPVYRQAEQQVWTEASRGLTPAQLQQMHTLIEEWRVAHPEQYYVADIHFTDFEAVERLTPNSSQVKLPGNILGLLYLDPLSGLDPVAAELKSYRDLTERMMYAAVRVPRLLGRQVNLQVRYALNDPQVLKFVSSTDRFSNATSQFSQTVANFPEDFSANSKAAIDQAMKGITTERQGAIDQANAAISSQRDSILKELDDRESKLTALVNDVKSVVARADQAGVSINAATTQTVLTTETATQRTLDHAFKLALTLVLVLLIGIPLMLLLYRMASKRMVGPMEVGR